MTRYAEGTKVTVDSSRGEISGILGKHGVVRQAWASTPEADTVQFELDGGTYRLTMIRPTADSMRARDGHLYAYPQNIDWQSKAEAEWRRVWRANVLLLKAKLEFAAGDGPTSVSNELMPYRLMKDGRTLGDVIAEGKLPLMLGAGS